jgi:hypothetical protein
VRWRTNACEPGVQYGGQPVMRTSVRYRTLQVEDSAKRVAGQCSTEQMIARADFML